MSDQHAREFHGLVRMIEDLGTAAEDIFSRFYTALSARDKVVVDKQKLASYRHKSEAIRERARQQTIEIARLTGILGTIGEGVVMQDPQGRIILMNEAARELIGSTQNFWRSELGQIFKDAQAITPVLRQMQMVGEPQQVAINNHMVAVRLAAINDDKGDHLGTVMLLRDITEESISERLRNSFIGHMSHELRTPLASIKGMSEVMLNLPEGTPPKRRFLEAISRNVGILDRMVVELLDVSEISSGEFAIKQEPLSLDDVMFHSLKNYESQMLEQDIQTTSMVKNPRALNIMGDQRRLDWALGHLLDNAVNYTMPGGNVTLQLGRVRSEHVLLQIKDTGVGIQTDDLPRIFERFYRITPKAPDGTTIDPRGLGQGLYIAQAVIEAHGGYINATSDVGEGSTFTIGLPIAS